MNYTPETAEITAMRIYDSMGFGPEWTGTAVSAADGRLQLSLVYKRGIRTTSSRRWLNPGKTRFEVDARLIWAAMKKELQMRPLLDESEDDEPTSDAM